jgi:hypothetical protein
MSWDADGNQSNQVSSLLHDILALEVITVSSWGSLALKHYKMNTISLVELKTVNNLQCSIGRFKGQAYNRTE